MKRDGDRSIGEHAGDCHGPDGAKDMCVAGAIANFTSQLLHYKHGSADRKCKQTKILTSSLKQRFSACMYLFVFFQVPTTFLFAMLADNLTEALLFLSHFMGDVHQVCSPAACFFRFVTRLIPWGSLQPMHVGFTSDQGGNSIDLRWYRHKSNLHHVRNEQRPQSSLLAHDSVGVW
jgi:hypothetical protein